MHCDATTVSAIAAEWTKIVGAVIAFVVALKQYTLAQKWKRGEFIARQIRDLEADPRIEAALTMLDWTGRSIPIQSSKTGRTTSNPVDERLLTISVLPRSPNHGFSDRQASIRDCFDHLLDGLVRLQNYVESDLISHSELKPYIDYWIKKIVGRSDPQHEQSFYVLLHQYIRVYEFDKARSLIEGYGETINWPEGDIQSALERTLMDAESYRQENLEGKKRPEDPAETREPSNQVD